MANLVAIEAFILGSNPAFGWMWDWSSVERHLALESEDVFADELDREYLPSGYSRVWAVMKKCASASTTKGGRSRSRH